MGIRVLSLFDGISCGMVALERAGIEVDKYVAYEIEESAIKISEYNYPQINHKGDVFKAEYKENEYDLLIGGSPCTYWSGARLNTGKDGTVERETEPTGLGFELFMQYVRALKEVKPTYFLYENNFSIHANIKNEITNILGVEFIVIDSALVSAQQRKRCYWTNIPNITQPTDKGILFSDIINKNRDWVENLPWSFEVWGEKRKIDTLRTVDSEKSFTVTTSRSHPKNYYLNTDRTMMSKLTADEVEILQTLPMGYTNCEKQGKRFKAIGNGWTADVIAHIFKGLKGEF